MSAADGPTGPKGVAASPVSPMPSTPKPHMPSKPNLSDISGAAGGPIPKTPGPLPGMPSGVPGGGMPSMPNASGGIPSMPSMPGGAPGSLPIPKPADLKGKVPREVSTALVGSGTQAAQMIDQLPPGSSMAAKALQNPVVASIASVVITSMAGTPISPTQVMQGAQLGELAIEARKDQKEYEQKTGLKH